MQAPSATDQQHAAHATRVCQSLRQLHMTHAEGLSLVRLGFLSCACFPGARSGREAVSVQ